MNRSEHTNLNFSQVFKLVRSSPVASCLGSSLRSLDIWKVNFRHSPGWFQARSANGESALRARFSRDREYVLTRKTSLYTYDREKWGLKPIPKSLATLVNVIEQSLRRGVSLRPFRVWLDFTGVPNLPGSLDFKIRK